MYDISTYICVCGRGGKVRIKVLESALLVDRAHKQDYNKENKIDNRTYFKAYIIDN